MTSTRALLPLLALTSGCYFFYPHDSKRMPPPPIKAGARIELSSENKVDWISCGDNITGCELRKGKWKKAIRWTEYTPSYGGDPVNQGQVHVLVDPLYEKKWKAMESKKGTCSISLVPSALFAVGAIGAIVAGAAYNSIGDNAKFVMIGAAGAMGLGAALSYPLGGYACMSARKIADDLDIEYSMAPNFVVSTTNKYKQAKLAELETLIDNFNRKAGEAPTPETDPAPETTAGDDSTTPTPDDPKATKPPALAASAVLDAVAATGKFPTFLKVIDNLELRELFADGESYTLLIPTEETFAKLSKAKLKRLTTGSATGMDAVTWKQHVVVGIRSEKQMVKDIWLEPIGGKHRVEVKKGETIIGGARIVGPAIKTPNAVIYPIDKLF